jgi:hypothetical protein
MDASSPESKASPWATRALIASALLLLMVNAFLSFLSTARETDDTGALGYWSYQFAGFLGAAFVTALIVGAVIGGARVAGHAKTIASKAKLAFWTLVVLLVLNSSILTRNARSPGTTMSRTDVTLVHS